jgi:hypothetical protein
MKTNQKIINELQRIAVRNGGILLPGKVVEAARFKSSPLHSQFEWDDAKAAHSHRLWQARQLIRVVVTVENVDGDKKPMHVFVSLKQDRKEGGYRETIAVLSDKDLRQQLLADAIADMQWFQEKYQSLTELAEVFSAMDKIQRRKINPEQMGLQRHKATKPAALVR